jgi:hypothetical protein
VSIYCLYLLNPGHTNPTLLMSHVSNTYIELPVPPSPTQGPTTVVFVFWSPAALFSFDPAEKSVVAHQCCHRTSETHWHRLNSGNLLKFLFLALTSCLLYCGSIVCCTTEILDFADQFRVWPPLSPEPPREFVPRPLQNDSLKAGTS